MRYRSGEELAMRELIVPKLRAAYPSARIIHELPLRYSTNRIDLAAVTEREIVSVEIKSSRDVMDRLEAQCRNFLPISAKLIVALAPKWNEQRRMKQISTKRVQAWQEDLTETQTLIRHISSSIEIWTVDAAAGTVTVTNPKFRDDLPWTGRMLDILHVAELRYIADRYRVCVGKQPNHKTLRDECHAMMTGREIVSAVCRALRSRQAFAAGTDAPIIDVEAADARGLTPASGDSEG